MPAKSRTRTKATPATVSDLTPNEANPRKPWTDPQRETFKKSLAEFGDLSGIVYNITTGHLIGGHKRVDEFRDGNPAIEKQVLDATDSAGTVAVGRVMINGTSFAYREVKWPKEKEAAATLAANKWGAEWDWEGVGNLLREAGNFDLTMTGFDASSIEGFLNTASAGINDGRQAEAPASSSREINAEGFEMEHKCPKCGFEFDSPAE